MTHIQKAKQRKAAVDYVVNGHTTEQAAGKFGLSKQYIRQLVNDGGTFERRKRRDALIHPSSAQWFEILAYLINTNRTYASIASEFDLTKQRIEQYAAGAFKAGIRLKKSRSRKVQP